MAHLTLEHIGFEQRVVHDAAQADPVVRKHVLVVLEVLPKLVPLAVLQPGAQQFERARNPDLSGDTGSAVRKRQIAGLARLD